MKILFFTLLFSLSLFAQTRPNPDFVGRICGTSCSNDFQIVGIFTNTGMCMNTLSTNCYPFTCDKTKKMCFTKCVTNNDCAEGSVCNVSSQKCAPIGYECKDAWTIIATSGQESSCNGYRCIAGTCQQTCNGPIDCFPGYVCQASHCVKR